MLKWYNKKPTVFQNTNFTMLRFHDWGKQNGYSKQGKKIPTYEKVIRIFIVKTRK